MDLLVGQQIFFCLCAPQAVVALGDLRQLCEQRVGLAELLKIGDGRQRKLDLRVDQLLAAADVRQVQRRIDNGGAGAGVTITPMAFVVIRGESVRMLPVSEPASTSVDRIVELVPDILDRIEGIARQFKDRKTEG